MLWSGYFSVQYRYAPSPLPAELICSSPALNLLIARKVIAHTNHLRQATENEYITPSLSPAPFLSFTHSIKRNSRENISVKIHRVRSDDFLNREFFTSSLNSVAVRGFPVWDYLNLREFLKNRTEYCHSAPHCQQQSRYQLYYFVSFRLFWLTRNSSPTLGKSSRRRLVDEKETRRRMHTHTNQQTQPRTSTHSIRSTTPHNINFDTCLSCKFSSLYTPPGGGESHFPTQVIFSTALHLISL